MRIKKSEFNLSSASLSCDLVTRLKPNYVFQYCNISRPDFFTTLMSFKTDPNLCDCVYRCAYTFLSSKIRDGNPQFGTFEFGAVFMQNFPLKLVCNVSVSYISFNTDV